MSTYLLAIWQRRWFWLALVKTDLRTRYRRSVLGLGWSLAKPLAMTAILCLVFHRLFEFDLARYVPYLLTGLACWQYIVNAAMHGCQCFYQAEAYIRQHPAPLAIYPLRTALGETIHFLMTLVISVVLTALLQGLPNPLVLLCLLPALVVLFVVAWSLAVLTGVANIFAQDTQYLTEIGFQMLFYATPIIYFADMLQGRRLGWLVEYNPLAALLALVREPIVMGRPPDAASCLLAGALAGVLLLAAALVLRQAQRRLIFYL